MFNNEITYHEKWSTPENKEYNKKVYKFLRGRVLCFSDCPCGWSKEVLDLLQELDKEFKIGYNMPYPMTLGRLPDAFLKSFKIFINHPYNYNTTPTNTLTSQIKKIQRFFSYQQFIFSEMFLTIKRKIIDKICQPKIHLSQVKEKYGRLEIYYSAPDYLMDYIDKKIMETEIKLATKGAYYKLEQLYKWESARSDQDGTKVTKRWYKNEGKRHYYTEISHYPYRSLIKELDSACFATVKARVDKKKLTNNETLK